MDLEICNMRVPIVYTTRLDDMETFRKHTDITRCQDVIKLIIAESKPRYEVTDSTCKITPCNATYRYNNKNHWQSYKSSKLTFKKLKSKLEMINNKSNDIDHVNDKIIKLKNETIINNFKSNKLTSLLALCKPLKIVLEDINKTVPKSNDEMKRQLLRTASVSDDDVIIVEEVGIKDKIQDNEEIKANKRGVISPAVNYTIKNINVFKDILKTEDLRNSVIVIYNLYFKNFDAYQIGDYYTVTEYKTRKYTEVYKFPMKKCRIIINIIACCWINRERYVSSLVNYKQYCDIAKFISSSHPCKRRCICCCFIAEQSSKAEDDVNNSCHAMLNDSLLDNSHAPSKNTSKLIDIALKFEKSPKWRGYPHNIFDLNDKNKRISKSSQKLLQLNNATGQVEFYEFGHENVIYSKLVLDKNNNSSWLSETIRKPRKTLNAILNSTIDREKYIIMNRKFNNLISFNSECFLRKPLTMDTEIPKTPNNDSNFPILYKIEHKRSFTGSSAKKPKVFSILPTVRTNEISSRPVANSTAPIIPSKVPARAHCKLDTPLKLSNAPIMEQNASEIINCLIRDILHRFRNVLLTINPDGKVSVALNAPLSSLNNSELKILSQILCHAQNQVDKLGLTPGTCLNPDTPAVINSATQTDDKRITQQTDKQKHLAIANNTKCQAVFPKITCKKINEYEDSFRSFLDDKIRSTPKITNVFSLNTLKSTSSDVLKRESTEIDNFSKTVLENTSIKETNVYVNNIKDEITQLDIETEPILPKDRKRKNNLNCNNIKSAKVRVKTTAEISDETSNTLLVSSHSNFTANKPSRLTALTPLVSTYVNYGPDNNCRSDIGVELKGAEYWTAPKPQGITEKVALPFYEVHADGTLIDNTNFFSIIKKTE